MGNDKKYSEGDDEFDEIEAMMDEIIARSEAGEATQEAIDSAAAARAAGIISWGSENGVVVGTLVNGTRIDTNGNILDEE